MGGVGGYSSWRWVFIIGGHTLGMITRHQVWLTTSIEGLATTVVSIFLYFVISDFPEEAKWLSEEEKAFIEQRLLDDVGDSGHHVKPGIRDVLGVFKDREYHHTWPPTKILTSPHAAKIIIAGFMYLGQVVPGCERRHFLSVNQYP